MTADPAPTRRIFWWLQLGGWGAFGVAMALSRLGRYPIGYMVATKAALAASGVAASLVLRAWYRRTLRDDAPLQRTIVVTVVGSFVMAQLWTAFYNLTDARIATAMLHRSVRIENATQLFATSLYHSFALLAWSVFYVGIKRHFALQEARERALRAEALAHQARLQALRFQIQPHFLFNTLNALSTLIVEQRSAEASRMLSRISDFLRHTLSAPDVEEVSLEREIEFARRYLDIEQARFGERMTVDIDVPPATRSARVPNLLLQPLLENAVRYAVAPRLAGGSIRVAARRDGSMLHLTVADDGPGAALPASTVASGRTGVGLANTRARLEQLYGSRQRMELSRSGDGGFRIDIELPFRDGAA